MGFEPSALTSVCLELLPAGGLLPGSIGESLRWSSDEAPQAWAYCQHHCCHNSLQQEVQARGRLPEHRSTQSTAQP